MWTAYGIEDDGVLTAGDNEDIKPGFAGMKKDCTYTIECVFQRGQHPETGHLVNYIWLFNPFLPGATKSKMLVTPLQALAFYRKIFEEGGGGVIH